MQAQRGIIAVGLALAALLATPLVAEHHEGAADPFMDDVIKIVQGTEKKLVALAEAMPEDMFSWAPSISPSSVPHYPPYRRISA